MAYLNSCTWKYSEAGFHECTYQFRPWQPAASLCFPTEGAITQSIFCQQNVWACWTPSLDTAFQPGNCSFVTNACRWHLPATCARRITLAGECRHLITVTRLHLCMHLCLQYLDSGAFRVQINYKNTHLCVLCNHDVKIKAYKHILAVGPNTVVVYNPADLLLMWHQANTSAVLLIQTFFFFDLDYQLNKSSTISVQSFSKTVKCESNQRAAALMMDCWQHSRVF